MTNIRVVGLPPARIIVYDRMGGMGDIQLTVSEAQHVRDRLIEILENND